MTRISKKSATITASILLFGACTGAAGYIIGNHTSDNSLKVATPKTNETNTALERATKLPDGTESPTKIAADITNYVDKEVSVHGLITQVDANTYIIVGQEAKDPGALPLDFSNAKDINPKDYASTPPTNDPNHIATIKDAVTVTGTIKRNDRNIVLVVTSVKE